MSQMDFVKGSLIVGISQIVLSFSSFLLLPIITKSLGPENYGIWVQLSVIVSLLVPFGLLNLSTALVRYLAAERDIEIFRDIFYSTLSFVIVMTGIVSLSLYLVSDFIAAPLFGDSSTAQYIKMGSALLFISTLDPIILYYMRIKERPKTFVFLSLLRAGSLLALVVLFLTLNMGITGVIIAYLLAGGFEITIGLNIIRNDIGITWPTFRKLKEMVLFSLPMVPNNLLKWISDSSDRFLIGLFLGIGMVGIYSASYSIGVFILTLSSPIQFILQPTLAKFYDDGKNDDVSRYLSYATREYLLLGIPAVFGLTALAPELITVLTSESFAEGSPVLPIVALSSLIYGLFVIVGNNIVVLVKKTKFYLLFISIAAVTNLLLNLLLIPEIGIIGSAIAYLSATTLMVVISTIITRRFITFHFPWSFVAKVIMASAVMVLVVKLLLTSDWLSILLAICIGISTFLAVFYLIRGFGPIEKTIWSKLWSKAN